jgi:hypothetical protein
MPCMQVQRYRDSLQFAHAVVRVIQATRAQAALLCPTAALAAGGNINLESQLFGPRWMPQNRLLFQAEETLPQPGIILPARRSASVGRTGMTSKGELLQLAEEIMLNRAAEVPNSQQFEQLRKLLAGRAHSTKPCCCPELQRCHCHSLCTMATAYLLGRKIILEP